MTVLRFVHTDHLRLGSPLTGLADCPDWLRRAAGGAVRKSVANVIEAAIASRSHFLLISGRIADQPQDLDVAVAWLAEQTPQLDHYGIRVVLTGYDSSRHSALRRLNAILCGPNHQLTVTLDGDHRPQIQVRPEAESHLPKGIGLATTPYLIVQRNSQPRLSPARHELAYRTVTSELTGRQDADGAALLAARQPPRDEQAAGAENLVSDRLTTVSEERALSIAADSPQSLGPAERGAHGCQLVEVDFQHSLISARFCATDVVRFARERLHCYPGMTTANVVSAIAERSRQIHTLAGRTTVLDWDLDRSVYGDPRRPDELDERSLLRALRDALDAGHSGIWPRRIHCGSAAAYPSRGAMTALAAG